MNLEIFTQFGKSLFGILAHLGRSIFEICATLHNYGTSRNIMVHYGKSFFGIFEILEHYGTSWKINLLESPSKYRLRPLHPNTLLGTRGSLGKTKRGVFTIGSFIATLPQSYTAT